MKSILYLLSSLLLLVPFLMGIVVGFFYRGIVAGFVCGFMMLHRSMETDITNKVRAKYRERLISLMHSQGLINEVDERGVTEVTNDQEVF